MHNELQTLSGRCPNDFKQVGQWCYKADTMNAVSPSSAKTMCGSSESGAHLAEITSTDEYAAFETWLQVCKCATSFVSAFSIQQKLSDWHQLNVNLTRRINV